MEKFKNHFVTGVWGDQLTDDSEDDDSEEDEHDAIIDLENEEESNGDESNESNESNEEESNGEEAENGNRDEYFSDEDEPMEDPHHYESIEEERAANAAKKAASRAAKEKAADDAQAISSDDEKLSGGKKKEKKEKEEDYFDLLKRKRAEQEEKTREEFQDVSQAERDLLLGLPTGTYCRIVLQNVPPAFLRLARPEIPVIVGGLLDSEEMLSLIRVVPRFPFSLGADQEAPLASAHPQIERPADPLLRLAPLPDDAGVRDGGQQQAPADDQVHAGVYALPGGVLRPCGAAQHRTPRRPEARRQHARVPHRRHRHSARAERDLPRREEAEARGVGDVGMR